MYNTDELRFKFNFKSLGNNVLISDKASIYGSENISIGSNVRIDDYVVISAGGEIEIGDYVHIGCHSSILGKGNVKMGDFSGISSKVSVFSSSDSYDGEFMTNPLVPEGPRRTYHKDVTLGKHVVVGANSVVLPGVNLEDGCAVGANSLVTKSFKMLSIIGGTPARFIRERKNNIFELEKDLVK